MKRTTVKRAFIIILISVLMLCFTGCKGKVINQVASGGADKEPGSDEHSGEGNLPGANNQQEENSPQSATTEAADQPQMGFPVVEDKPGTSAGLAINMQPAPQVQLNLQPYDGGFFSMDLPVGWEIEPVGQYENFGFRAYDPNSPARQIFFYGNMKYFLKSDAGKEAWETYLAFGGYGDAQVYADALVLSPATTEQFFYTFNDYTSYAKKYGVVHNFAALNDLEIVESTPRNSPIASNCVDDSIVRALFTQNDTPCEGLFAAGVANAMTTYMYNVDAGYYVVYYITGISAPADEFYALQETLSQSLSSFHYSQSYIDKGVQQIDEGTKLALEIGKMLSQAADSNNQAWHDRQRSIDALSQKRSDAKLGYDRLYDTETGETYRAELGFYDEYDINRNEYGNPNLQLVPDDGYSLYEKGVSGYIYK
jgi:hypothetical protein